MMDSVIWSANPWTQRRYQQAFEKLTKPKNDNLEKTRNPKILREQVKPSFYKLPAAPKVLLGLSKIEGKGKLVKTKCLKISESLKNSESLKSLKLPERILRFTMDRT